ncbi:MAG: hypothetical protein WCH83_15100, partial [Alphaproteobacteria bacterium]
EVDRFERQRQRAFSRLPIAPPPEPVTVTPAIATDAIVIDPALLTPPSVPRLPQSPPASVPQPRSPRAAAPPSPDFATTVRRALDANQPAPPLSILPPLPPPLEVGPAPGTRR